MRIVRKYLPALPVIAALGLLASVLEGVGISLIIPLLSVLLSTAVLDGVPAPIQSVSAFFASYDAQTRVVLLSGAIVILIALKGVVQSANSCYVTSVENRIGRDLRNTLARRLLDLDYGFFLQQDTARLSRIMTTDSWFVGEAIRSALTLIPAIVAVAVFGAFLAWLNVTLFLVVLAGTVFTQAVLYLFEKRQRRLSTVITATDHAIWDRMLTLVNASRVIRIFGQQRQEQSRFARVTEQFRQSLSASRYHSAFVGPTMESIVSVVFVVIVLVAYLTGVSLAAATAFLVVLSRLQPIVSKIRTSRLEIAAARGSLSEVEWLLSQRPSAQRATAAVPADPIELNQPISVDGVSYIYPNGTAALRDVSFTIRPGVATALLGKSGSGKTTIANLLCRLLEPQSGSILLGSRPANSISAESWRARIAVAGQDMDLVHGTIVENIVYGQPDACISDVEEAALLSGAAEFIAALPQGYHTYVGRAGLTLSIGQRQRIGLARALLRKPDLLILDEATSAVDALTEMETIRLFSQKHFFHTALLISHRKSTLAACEDGIVLADGKICATGPLATLPYFRTMAGTGGAEA